MADFLATIKADLDTSKAKSQMDSFCNATYKARVDVDLQLSNAGQSMANIIAQFQAQGRSAGSQFAASFNNSLGQIKTTQAVQQFDNLNNALRHKFNFSDGAISNITRSLTDMDLAVQSVQTKMRSKGGLDVTVKGVDQMGRAVTITKQFDADGRQLQSTLNAVAKAEKLVSQQQMSVAGNNLTAWAKNNSKAVKEYGDRINELQNRMRDMQHNGATTSQFKQWQEDLKVLQSEARSTGNIGKTFGESFASSFGNIAQFAASYVSISRVFSEIQEGVRTIVDLDTALVDLQKTTTASKGQLNDFYYQANDIAKQYGVSTQQIIQGAADWSRLG